MDTMKGASGDGELQIAARPSVLLPSLSTLDLAARRTRQAASRLRRCAATFVLTLLAAVGSMTIASVVDAHQVIPAFGHIRLVVGQNLYVDITNTSGCVAHMGVAEIPISDNDNDGNNDFILSTSSPETVTAIDGSWAFTAQSTGTSLLDYFWTGQAPCTDIEGPYQKIVEVIDPQPDSGTNAPAPGTDGDPVNTFNGELFSYEKPDLSLGGPLPLHFSRYYASYLRRSFVVGDLGDNWRHNFEWAVHWTGNNLVLMDNRGRVVRYLSDGAGNWTQQNNLHLPYKLLQDGNNEINLFNPENGLFYHFDAYGRLEQIADANGNAHTLIYDDGAFNPSATGKLKEVNDGKGRSLHFLYTTKGALLKLATVQERQNGIAKRAVQFTYDGTGDNMLSFQDVNGNFTVYTYAAPDGADRGMMLSKQLPRGNIPYQQTFYTVADGIDSGKVKTQTDALNNTHTFSYGPTTTTLTDPLSATRTHTHTASGSISSTIDKNGTTASFGSDGTGRRSAVADKLGGTTSYAYDPLSAQLSSVGNADGTTTTYTHSSRVVNGFTLRDLTRIDYPDGTHESYTYDGAGNLLNYTNRAGNATTYTYNSAGQPLQITIPLGGTTQYSYNADGTLLSTTDHSGNVTSFSYDSMRRLSGVLNADATTRAFAYNLMDQPLTLIDERGNVTSFTYDNNGNVLTMVDRAGAVTSYSYDAMDRLVSVQDPLGNTLSRTFDALGRPATIADAGGNTVTLDYDVLGRLKSRTDASGNEWRRSFDAESIIASTTDPLTNGASFSSDAMGRITSGTTPEGGAASFTYDSMGRVSAVTDPRGNTTSKTYDALGLTSSVTLPGGATSASYVRNSLGQITSVTDALGNNWQRQYDAQGRLIARSDPLGNQTTVSFDNRNRPSIISYPGGGGTLTLSYDANGNMAQRTYSSGPLVLGFTYDNLDRLASANGIVHGYDAAGAMVNSNGLTATYNIDGRLATMTLAPGKVLTYSYDVDGRLISINDWVGGSTSFGYDGAGRVISIGRPNGVTTTQTYDSNGLVTGIAEGSISTISLTRNLKGQVTAATKNLPSTASTGAATARSASFDAANQSLSSSYDARGRLSSDATGRSYVWDAASRLVSYTENANTIAFAYDANGRRISRTEGGVTRGYTWNDILAMPSVSVVHESAADLRYYVHTPSGLLLYSVEALDNSRRYYHSDETGAVTFVTNDAGTVIGSYAYSPYGEMLASAGGLDNPFTWQGIAGVMREGGSGLYYNRARYYDSHSARFISREPLQTTGPRSINPYQYAWGDPQQFADATGLAPGSAHGLTVTEPFDNAPRTLVAVAPTGAGVAPFNNRQTVTDKPATGTPTGPTIAGSGGTGLLSAPSGASTATGSASACGGGFTQDWEAAGVSVGFDLLERGFKRHGKNIIQRGLQGGSFAGAATAGTRAAAAKGLGAFVGGVFSASDEYDNATAQGQSGASVAGRTAWAGATGTVFNYAAAPVALVDSLTGGNVQGTFNQVGNVSATLLEGERAFDGYRQSMESAPPVVRGLHNAGEAFTETGAGEWFIDTCLVPLFN